MKNQVLTFIMADPIFTPALAGYFLIFTYATLLGGAVSYIASGSKYAGFWYGVRRKFHIETEQNNPKGFYTVLSWLACHQWQISTDHNTVAKSLGPYTLRIPVHGNEFEIKTKYGVIYVEAMGDDNNIGGFCLSVYKRKWYYFWWFFGFGAWYVNSDEINKLNYFVKELYENVNMYSPFCDLPDSEKPKKPTVIYPNVKPIIPSQLNRIINKMKMMAFGEDYDLWGNIQGETFDSQEMKDIISEDDETAPFMKKDQ